MRRYFAAVLLLLSFTSKAQDTTADSVWLVQHYTKVERMITMRDGTKLFTAIYAPKDSSEKHPILMTRTPYSCAPYGEKNYRKFWTTYHMKYAKEGYIFVYQDVRGRYLSEGIFQDVRPFNTAKKTPQDIDEASDTYDTIDWLVKNVSGNNNKVGVFGISYPGFYSTMAALSGHPSLKAVSPQAPVTDWFMGDDFHHNGAFMLIDAFEFYKGFGVPRPQPVQEYVKGYIRNQADAYAFYLAGGPIPTFTSKYLGDSIGFWNDLIAHPNYDAWWQARNPRNFVNNLKPAMLVVGGTFDAEDCFGAWNLYKAIEEKNSSKSYNKLVMGPWFHGAWGGRSTGYNLGKVKFGSKTSEWYQQNIEMPFFQYYLKGKGNTDSITEANVFFTGENSWHHFAQWPPKNISYQNLYLLPAHSLSFEHPRSLKPKEKPSAETAWSQYTSDPANPVPHESDTIKNRTREYMTADQRYAQKRADVLYFQTDTLQQDIVLGGPLTADLNVSITGTDADFVIKLIDVFPANITSRDTAYAADSTMNGYQMLVRGEIMRGRFRNSFEKPEPFVSNKITRVKFTMPDVAHTFLKGHRIMVQVQSSWFPLVDRNPQTFVDIYHAKQENFKAEDIRIYHTEGITSKIVLPVLP